MPSAAAITMPVVPVPPRVPPVFTCTAPEMAPFTFARPPALIIRPPELAAPGRAPLKALTAPLRFTTPPSTCRKPPAPMLCEAALSVPAPLLISVPVGETERLPTLRVYLRRGPACHCRHQSGRKSHRRHP